MGVVKMTANPVQAALEAAKARKAAQTQAPPQPPVRTGTPTPLDEPVRGTAPARVADLSGTDLEQVPTLPSGRLGELAREIIDASEADHAAFLTLLRPLFGQQAAQPVHDSRVEAALRLREALPEIVGGAIEAGLSRIPKIAGDVVENAKTAAIEAVKTALERLPTVPSDSAIPAIAIEDEGPQPDAIAAELNNMRDVVFGTLGAPGLSATVQDLRAQVAGIRVVLDGDGTEENPGLRTLAEELNVDVLALQDAAQAAKPFVNSMLRQQLCTTLLGNEIDKIRAQLRTLVQNHGKAIIVKLISEMISLSDDDLQQLCRGSDCDESTLSDAATAVRGNLYQAQSFFSRLDGDS
jgi:hypothetical protein